MPANTKKNPSRAALNENRRVAAPRGLRVPSSFRMPRRPRPPMTCMLTPPSRRVAWVGSHAWPTTSRASDPSSPRSTAGGPSSTAPAEPRRREPVGEAVASVLTGPLSNRGTIGESEERAEAAVHGFRLAMADLLDGHPRGIVHGRSATQLTYDFSRHLSTATGARATRSS